MTNEHSNELFPSPDRTIAAQKQPRGVHLVGSIPLSSSEEVFRTASAILGERLLRLPDGETGERSNWIAWQFPLLVSNPALEMLPPDLNGAAFMPRIKLRSPAPASGLTFGRLGYADAAKASYKVFSPLKQAGVIPPQCRFQVSLPTPYAITVPVVPEDKAVFESAYEAAMFAELDEIAAALPPDELAIQWDVAIEIVTLEGMIPAHVSSDVKGDMLKQLIRLGNRVPGRVELGYHLCYGDAGHKHFVEPKDAALLVEVTNALSAGVTHEIQWIHMPVPRNRTDDAYFAPLQNLQLRPETKLYLGLVHHTDGVAGTRRRIAAAQKVRSDFGVATECGMGRRPAETIPALLRIHSEVAAPVSA